MKKFLIYVKCAVIFVLIIIVVLWLSYFLDSIYKSQHVFFLKNNYALNFLQWIAKVSNGALIFRYRIFDDVFYLEDFPGVSLFTESIFVILLVVTAILQKQRRKRYAWILCVSILCFVGLFEFLDSTLRLFVPG